MSEVQEGSVVLSAVLQYVCVEYFLIEDPMKKTLLPTPKTILGT